MAALGWLLNLDFAAGGTPPPVIAPATRSSLIIIGAVLWVTFFL